MFLPDKTKKTVRIRVRLNGDNIARCDGKPLPKVAEDALGDLVLPAASLTDEAQRRELEKESTIELLPAGTWVFIGLSPSTMKRKPRGLLTSAQLNIGHGYFFAEVRLREPLGLRRRGDKEPCLEPCECDIPVFNTNARSLNHAFTLLSTKFEAERISHTGNVFTRVFFRGNIRWHLLNQARGKIDLTGY